MGGRKIYLFATRGSFVSLPLVSPSSPRRCPGLPGRYPLPRRAKSATVVGDARCASRGAGGQNSRGQQPSTAPRLTSQRGGRGTARDPPLRAPPARKRNRAPQAPAAHGLRGQGRGASRGASCAVQRPPVPPLLGQEARTGGEAAPPQEPSAVADKSWYRRKAACSALSLRLARGTEPAGRRGPAAGTANFVGRRVTAASPAGGTGAAARGDPQLRPGPARLCPALPWAAAVGAVRHPLP